MEIVVLRDRVELVGISNKSAIDHLQNALKSEHLSQWAESHIRAALLNLAAVEERLGKLKRDVG